jgi:hypothetical protein
MEGKKMDEVIVNCYYRRGYHANKIAIKENGVVDVVEPVYNPYTADGFNRILSDVSDAIKDTFNQESNDYFWRFTNNKNEIALIKAGTIHRSNNFITNELEKGLSVATHSGYACQGYNYGYKIAGTVIDYGSDGEPVLDIKSLRPLSKMLANAAINAEYRKEKEERLSNNLPKYNWTAEQYNRGYGCETTRDVIFNIIEED